MNLMIYSIQIFPCFSLFPSVIPIYLPFSFFSISCSFNQSFENSPFSAFFPRGPGRSGNCHAAGGRWVGATGGFLVDPVEPCRPLLRTPDHCHWRELPQYHFCRDKHVFCRDKSMLAMTKLLSRQNYVGPATNIILSRQKLLSRQAWQNFCCDKIMFVATNVLSQQKYGCRYKTFVATKMILVAAPANDRSPPRLNWTIHPMQPCKHCQESRLCFWKNRKEYRV